jgi:Fe-S oxidoreductase
MRNIPAERRYDYFKGLDRSEGTGRVGYFAGCMTLLTPRTMTAMEQIFNAVNEQVWWADRNGGVCCGRPLKLSGETDSARKMMRYNTELFRKHNIRTLVTSCPICLKVFKEDYDLEGIEVLHHSEYIERLLRNGRLVLEKGVANYTYHDPCELGRGGGIYDAPRTVIEAVGALVEAEHNRRDSLCCGSSLANTVIDDASQLRISTAVTEELAKTEASTIVTACPLCKKALARSATQRVEDLAEVVAQHIAK